MRPYCRNRAGTLDAKVEIIPKRPALDIPRKESSRRKSVLAQPFFQTPEAAYMKWWLDYINDRGEPNIATPTFTELNEVMVDALHQILLNPSSNIKQVLDAAVARYNQMARA